MPLRLNNKFDPEGHNKAETKKTFSLYKYSKAVSKPIIQGSKIPVLALGSFCVLLGYAEEGEFKAWLDKIYVRGVSAEASFPENILVSLILKAAALYPNPEALIDRVIRRLIEVKNNSKRNINKTQTPKGVDKC